jgi:hypothetical protein
VRWVSTIGLGNACEGLVAMIIGETKRKCSCTHAFYEVHTRTVCDATLCYAKSKTEICADENERKEMT